MSDFEFREPAVVSEELRMLRDQARRLAVSGAECNTVIELKLEHHAA